MHTQDVPVTPEQLDLVDTNTLIRALMRRSNGLLITMEALGHLADGPRVYSQGSPDVVNELGKISRRAAFEISRNGGDDLGIAG